MIKNLTFLKRAGGSVAIFGPIACQFLFLSPRPRLPPPPLNVTQYIAWWVGIGLLGDTCMAPEPPDITLPPSAGSPTVPRHTPPNYQQADCLLPDPISSDLLWKISPSQLWRKNASVLVSFAQTCGWSGKFDFTFTTSLSEGAQLYTYTNADKNHVKLTGSTRGKDRKLANLFLWQAEIPI